MPCLLRTVLSGGGHSAPFPCVSQVVFKEFEDQWSTASLVELAVACARRRPSTIRAHTCFLTTGCCDARWQVRVSTSLI